MARIRTIKPEIWLSPQVMNLSLPARLLFIGLITQADDSGRGIADPRKLKAAIFPGDDEITCARILELKLEIVSQKLIELYDGGDHGRVYWLPTWKQHQSIDRPRKSSYPPCHYEALIQPSTIIRRTLVEDSTMTREGSDLKDRTGPDLTGPDRSDPEERAPVLGAGALETAEERKAQVRAKFVEEFTKRFGAPPK